tara:strand:- start:163 stop:471 length:309 start_codon:yes stop_codon:yes gene_type:complete
VVVVQVMLLPLQEKWHPVVDQVAVVKITVMVLTEMELLVIQAAQTLFHHLMDGEVMVETDLLQHMEVHIMLVVAAVVPVVMAQLVVVQEINMDLVEMVLNIR